MNKKENLKTILENMGYLPSYDDDGDVRMKYQMKNIFFITSDDEEDKYVTVLFPQFVELENDEVSLALAVCNKMTRELKLAKTYVDASFQTVSASCDFFYADEESLTECIKRSLDMIGLVRSQYFKTKQELTD